MKLNLLQKTVLFLSLLFICNLGYAVETITFKWKGNGDNTREIELYVWFGSARCSIDWGNGDKISSFPQSIGDTGDTATSPVYGDDREYTVTITGKMSSTSFKSLNISGCEVSELNISGTSLKTLNVANNNLTTLDVSKNNSLLDVACYNNKLSLKNLFEISEKTISNEGLFSESKTRTYGTQTLETETWPKEELLNLAGSASFNNTQTVFTVYKGSDLIDEPSDHCLFHGYGVYTFLTPGEYTIEMTNTAINADDNYPAKVIATYIVSGTTSIDQNEATELYCYIEGNRLYANNIENDSPIMVYNLNGQQVLHTLYSEGVDLSSLTNGTYLLKTINMENTRHAKFIKK